jgi:hypothetical protein
MHQQVKPLAAVGPNWPELAGFYKKSVTNVSPKLVDICWEGRVP